MYQVYSCFWYNIHISVLVQYFYFGLLQKICGCSGHTFIIYAIQVVSGAGFPIELMEGDISVRQNCYQMEITPK